MPTVVTVRLLDVPYRADRDYDYLLPDGMAEGDPVGRIALLPFGMANRPSYGIVTAMREDASPSAEGRHLKAASALLPPEYRLLPEILRLCFFLRSHTLCSVGEAVRAAMPSAALGLLSEGYEATVAPSFPLRRKRDALLAFLSERGFATREEISDALGESAVKGTLGSLLREGAVCRRFVRRAEARPQTVRTYELAHAREDAFRILAESDRLKNEKQRAVYRFLLDTGSVTADEVTERLNVSLSPLHTLVRAGLVRQTETERERNPYAALASERDTSPVVLSRAQEEAYARLSSLYGEHRAACALLHGVTGSGKTRVMMKLLDRVLAEGGQAILMVPEIALTPQTVGIFCSRYGERVSVLHSSLSTGERFDAYRKILRGDADLVIGTRSAVFAPLSRLSLIIIDEEHEHTYKSDAAPRYHTRDVAAFRAAEHGALCVLASATPSVESYYKAKTGKYTLVPLTERYGGALLPETEIVDMREELRAGNTSPISRRLSEALSEVRADGKQAILFLGRRGYHHAVSCRACGEALLCPHCSVSFTHHTGYMGDYLLCHACGAKRPMPRECPACGAEHLSFLGAGTQRAEAELVAQTGGRVLRMDADTTSTRTSYERILGRFRRGEADVLLGTQMVTKGHDFPNVSLSGVLLADASLYQHDFRAAERTFSLLTQVIGRAGRASAPGIAIVQTLSPDNAVIRMAAAQDYPAFYEQEIAFRRAMRYPPFCDIAEIAIRSDDENALVRGAKEVADRLSDLLRREGPQLSVEVYGPLEAGLYKVAGQYRMKLLIKCRLSTFVRELLGRFIEQTSAAFPRLTLSVDFNPTDT